MRRRQHVGTARAVRRAFGASRTRDEACGAHAASGREVRALSRRGGPPHLRAAFGMRRPCSSSGLLGRKKHLLNGRPAALRTLPETRPAGQPSGRPNAPLRRTAEPAADPRNRRDCDTRSSVRSAARAFRCPVRPRRRRPLEKRRPLLSRSKGGGAAVIHRCGADRPIVPPQAVRPISPARNPCGAAGADSAGRCAARSRTYRPPRGCSRGRR